MIKRLFDIVCSAGGILVLSPLLLWISWRIKREDSGPIFYRGERVGLHGSIFRIYKFRTMVIDAEKLGGSSTSDDDPRITEIGKTLRKYKLDELPQLFNVLTGEMSLVGPRPEIKRYTDLYTEEQKAIFTVRPGITDWASLWNSDEGAILAGAEDPDKAFEELIQPTKLKLQLKYVRERSFWVDMKIIFLTILAVMKPESQAVKELKGES
ncbi:MAG: sugar transferase [Candidatus Omnitrophota bacterium]|jgi:lipopolysaccharide/colanic/teichoic acid biosynthesis glycosyltransferase